MHTKVCACVCQVHIYDDNGCVTTYPNDDKPSRHLHGEHLYGCACVAVYKCVCVKTAVRDRACERTRVCVCVWLGFKIVSRACVINVPEREGPKDISQEEREQRECSGEEEEGGRSEKDRLARKKKRR